MVLAFSFCTLMRVALHLQSMVLYLQLVTAHAGDDVAAILLVHAYTSALYYLIIRHR